MANNKSPLTQNSDRGGNNGGANAVGKHAKDKPRNEMGPPEPKIATPPGHKKQLTNAVEDRPEDQGIAKLVTQGRLGNKSAILSEEVQQFAVLEQHGFSRQILQWLGKQVTAVVVWVEVEWQE